MTHPQALTIAGSDSGGGAGIQADIKTMQEFGVFGTTAITAVTAQNTLGVQAVQVMPLSLIAAQIDAVAADFTLTAVKTGMLADSDIIACVAEKIKQHKLPGLVIDPVMIAKGGTPLLQESALDSLRRLLLPQACVITPNIPEAEALVGYTLQSRERIVRAARELCRMGAFSVVLKGGHSGEDDAADFFAVRRMRAGSPLPVFRHRIRTEPAAVSLPPCVHCSPEACHCRSVLHGQNVLFTRPS